MTTLSELLTQADVTGCVEIRPGVYLNSQENITADQVDWTTSDRSKFDDFTQAPYWITTSNGAGPFAIHDWRELDTMLGHIDHGQFDTERTTY